MHSEVLRVRRQARRHGAPDLPEQARLRGRTKCLEFAHSRRAGRSRHAPGLCALVCTPSSTCACTLQKRHQLRCPPTRK